MDAQEKLIRSIKAKVKLNSLKVGKYLISYAEVGRGKPIILIHGANIGWGQWYPNIAQLAKHFKVYAIDLPGSGASSKFDIRNSSIEDLVEAVEKFITSLKLKKIKVVGHSFGGLIVLKLALKKDSFIDKMVLVNPMGLTSNIPFNQKLLSVDFIAKLLSKTVMRPNRNNIKKFLEDAMVNISNIKDEFVDYYHQAIKEERATHPFLFINSLTENFKVKKDLVVGDLNAIKQPTMIILGDKDPITQPTKNLNTYKLIKGAKIHILSNTGHAPSLERIDKFNSLAINFLRS